MRNLIRTFLAVVSLLMFATAEASLLTVDYSDQIKSRVQGLVDLRSQDGVVIRIEYEKLVSQHLDRLSTWARAKDQTGGAGELIKVELLGENLTLSDPVRIVFLNYCRSNIYRYQVFEDQNQILDMKYDGVASKTNGMVTFVGHVAGPVVVDQQNPSGQSFHCVQEVAVVVNGRWLVDPINHRHNFMFMF